MAHIVLKTGIASNGPAFEPGDVVDWPEVEAKRLVERGWAEEASADEIKAAQVNRKLRKYTPPPAPKAEAPHKSRVRERGELVKDEA